MKTRFAFIIAFVFITLNSYSQQKIQSDVVNAKPDTAAGLPDTVILRKVEKESEFTGGKQSWIKFLEHNLDGTIPTFNGAPYGTYTVVVDFIVYKDGSIGAIRPETHYGYGMEKEVIRILKLSPKWTPGFQNGKFVNSYRRQPVTFLVD